MIALETTESVRDTLDVILQIHQYDDKRKERKLWNDAQRLAEDC